MESKQEEEKKKRSFLFRLFKVFAWIFGSLLFLIILVLLLIQTSFVQNFARKKVVSYLENKLKTKVAIGKLDIKFPTALSLQNVYFEDQTKDTLLSGGEIKVDISMFKLIRSDIEIQEIALNDIVLKIKRLPPDSVFNFQFIADAFSGAPKKESATQDTSSLNLNIEQILINRTRIVYKDALTGNDMDLAIGHFDTKISKFDPSHLLFDIPTITLNGLKGHFYQLEPLQKPIENTVAEAAAPSDHFLQFLNKVINISDVNVVYKSEPSHLNSTFIIGSAQLHPKTFDLKNSIINFNDVALNNSDISIETESKAADKNPKDSTLTVAPTPSLKIIAGEITIKNSNLKYDDQSAPHAPSGMDFSHLGLQDLSINAKNIQYGSDTIIAAVESATLKEKSGFELDSFTTHFLMMPTGVFLTNLYLKTPGSELKNRAYITYASLAAIKKNPGELGMVIDLQNSKFAMKDLWTFAPQLKEQTASLSPDATLYIDTKITGKVSDLTFERLSLKGLC